MSNERLVLLLGAIGVAAILGLVWMASSSSGGIHTTADGAERQLDRRVLEVRRDLEVVPKERRALAPGVPRPAAEPAEEAEAEPPSPGEEAAAEE